MKPREEPSPEMLRRIVREHQTDAEAATMEAEWVLARAMTEEQVAQRLETTAADIREHTQGDPARLVALAYLALQSPQTQREMYRLVKEAVEAVERQG